MVNNILGDIINRSHVSLKVNVGVHCWKGFEGNLTLCPHAPIIYIVDYFRQHVLYFFIFYHFVKIIWHMYLISIALQDKNRFILYTWRCGCGWHRLWSLELRNVQSMSLDFLVEAVKMLYGQSEGTIHCFAPRIFKRSWTSLSLPYEPRLNVNVSLTRYVKLLVAHAPSMPGTFSPPPTSK